jgi:hypothetical protein
MVLRKARLRYASGATLSGMSWVVLSTRGSNIQPTFAALIRTMYLFTSLIA